MPASDRTSLDDSTPLTLTEWARAQAPRLSEVSNSNPNAILLRHNLVAVTDDLEAARAIALEFERTAAVDADTSMLVLGHAESRESKHQLDPEGVITHAAKRSLIGGIPGGLIFAIVIGVAVWLITKNAAATIGGAVGGAIFGFYASAMVSFVIGTGQSSAYRHSFVDPDAADAIIVAVHSEDRALIDEARRAVGDPEHVRLFEVDAGGRLAK